MSAQPFVVDLPKEFLDDLRDRLKRTRWLPTGSHSDWNRGTNSEYLRELHKYWQEGFDWRLQESLINRFKHFRAEIDGLGVHFIHERGKGDDPLPIILTHGYPDSFLRFSKVIPMLTDPESHGGDPADAFDVVVPSLPGYGFSDKPTKPGMTFKIADLWASLMTDMLGYERYAAHGR
jgi:epoxide hydrolase-like protein